MWGLVYLFQCKSANKHLIGFFFYQDKCCSCDNDGSAQVDLATIYILEQQCLKPLASLKQQNPSLLNQELPPQSQPPIRLNVISRWGSVDTANSMTWHHNPNTTCNDS